MVTASDGARIPVSLVRRADLVAKPGPVLLGGYGAYGDCNDPQFDRDLLPLLERGVGYAIAHVRGGGERGQAWHEAGRFDRKHHSFTDLAAVAQALVDERVAAPGAIVLRGGSAGGLLMATAVLQHPERYAGAVLESPFVDVLDAMLDPSLPLTAGEYDEWGDPRRPADFAWMRSWAPMELVQARAYPAVLATVSWNDTAVRVWEAPRLLARMRAATTGSAPLLVQTAFSGAGHGGPSGRYAVLALEAQVQAFILWRLEVVP